MQLLRYRKYFFHKYVIDKLYPKETYSQNTEDLVIEALLGEVNSFIDIGANDGITLSNSYYFTQRGARGLCFEPVSLSYRKLLLYHLFNPKVKCINEALSDEDKLATVCVKGYEGLESSIETAQKKTESKNFVKKERVKARSLSHWIRKYPSFQTPDFVSIDAEGHEAEILEGVDFKILKTKCFIIETDKVEISDIDKHLKKEGYMLTLTNGLNTFWCMKDVYNKDTLKRICDNFNNYQIIN